jgi:hypothetical protein
MRLMMLLAACSILAGCNSVPRPDTDLCVNNAQLFHKKCYNLARDYDDAGNLKPDAKPIFKPLASLSDADKDVCTSPAGWANLKAYIRALREVDARRGDSP